MTAQVGLKTSGGGGGGGSSEEQAVVACTILVLIPSHKMKTHVLRWKLCPYHLKLVREVKHFSEPGFSLEPQAGAQWSRVEMGLV